MRWLRATGTVPKASPDIHPTEGIMVQSNVSVNSSETVKIISEETDHKLKAQFRHMATLLGLVGEDLDKALQSDHGLQLIGKAAVSAMAARRQTLKEANFNKITEVLSKFLQEKIVSFKQFHEKWLTDSVLRENIKVEPKFIEVNVENIPLPPNVQREELIRVIEQLQTARFFQVVRRNVQVSKDSKPQSEVYLKLDSEHMKKYETDQSVSE